MSEEKRVEFVISPTPIVPDDSPLKALVSMYQKYAATREAVPNIAADTAIRFARYVLDHQSELASD
jgi:hypothetical protein